jgi:hypothetical protein
MNSTTLSNPGLLRNLGLMRSLHSTATNPFILIPCLFTGPPGWIFLAVAFSVPKRRIEKLLRAARTTSPEEAAQYFEAALTIDPRSEEVRKTKEEVGLDWIQDCYDIAVPCQKLVQTVAQNKYNSRLAQVRTQMPPKYPHFREL